MPNLHKLQILLFTMGNHKDPNCKWSFLYETLQHLVKVLPYLIEKTSSPLTAPVPMLEHKGG